MTGEPKLITDYTACTAPAANDLLLGCGNSVANVFKYSLTSLFGNSNVSIIVANTQYLRLTTHATPANSTVGGYPNNALFCDNNYIYAVLANGYIKRSALDTF